MKRGLKVVKYPAFFLGGDLTSSMKRGLKDILTTSHIRGDNNPLDEKRIESQLEISLKVRKSFYSMKRGLKVATLFGLYLITLPISMKRGLKGLWLQMGLELL
uniref:hypothetical protein n=1 Tax=Ferroglobus placidus TaxID=54261 RepID=UPI0001B74E3D|nr:hypothetical protein [Ferroglobus placidus]